MWSWHLVCRCYKDSWWTVYYFRFFFYFRSICSCLLYWCLIFFCREFLSCSRVLLNSIFCECYYLWLISCGFIIKLILCLARWGFFEGEEGTHILLRTFFSFVLLGTRINWCCPIRKRLRFSFRHRCSWISMIPKNMWGLCKEVGWFEKAVLGRFEVIGWLSESNDVYFNVPIEAGEDSGSDC